MKLHSISYDLLTPGKDYERLYARLRALGARRVLFSQWMLKSTMTAAELRDDLARYIDGNDRLLVIANDGSMAWTTLLAEIKVAFGLS